jgi:hypothetical protein
MSSDGRANTKEEIHLIRTYSARCAKDRVFVHAFYTSACMSLPPAFFQGRMNNIYNLWETGACPLPASYLIKNCICMGMSVLYGNMHTKSCITVCIHLCMCIAVTHTYTYLHTHVQGSVHRRTRHHTTRHRHFRGKGAAPSSFATLLTLSCSNFI